MSQHNSAQDNLALQGETTGETAGANDAIYDVLVTALRSNARGRAFLDEYARRARQADTVAALSALARIEALLLRQGPHAAQAAPVHEISPDDAYVPFEFGPLPDATVSASDRPNVEQPTAAADQILSAADPGARRTSADLLAQVMALSPEERIALFS